MAIAGNNAAASKHTERVAQVAVQTRAKNLGRGRAAPEQVAHLTTVDLKGREALSKGAGGDGARGDGDIGASAAGVEVGAETDETGDLTCFKVHCSGHVEDDGGDGRSSCRGIWGGDRADAEGEERREDESGKMHVGFLVWLFRERYENEEKREEKKKRNKEKKRRKGIKRNRKKTEDAV